VINIEPIYVGFTMQSLNSHSETSRYFITSLAKGLEVLSCFGAGTPSLSLKELCEQMGWPKGSGFRYTFTLQKLGYLDQDPVTKRYRPGVKVLSLGFDYLNSLELAESAQSHLEKLFHETGYPTHMAVLDGAEIVYVARRADRSLTTINLFVGARLPAYCTSMGRVLLAYSPVQQVRALLAGAVMVKHTAKTITDIDGLEVAFKEIRTRGYCMTDQELEIGVRSVAAPVRDSSGEVIASVNVSTLAARVDLEELEGRVLPRLLEASAQISSGLRYVSGARAIPT
jgi:IclR family pca regulon transcriptional regulator